MTCNKFLNLSAQLAIDGNLAPLNQHRASCPVCRATESASRASYRVPSSWRSVAHVEPCAGGCQWSDVAGVRVCWKCGQVKP